MSMKSGLCTHIIIQDSGVEAIAVATAQKIQCFTTKGKAVFCLETNLVEPILQL